MSTQPIGTNLWARFWPVFWKLVKGACDANQLKWPIRIVAKHESDELWDMPSVPQNGQVQIVGTLTPAVFPIDFEITDADGQKFAFTMPTCP
jgi:hypothetical protein